MVIPSIKLATKILRKAFLASFAFIALLILLIFTKRLTSLTTLHRITSYNVCYTKLLRRDGRNLSLEGLLEENRVLEGELAGIVERVNDINKSIMLMQEDYNRVEVKKTKLESELEVFKNKLWDEYELTYNNALEMKKEISNIRAAQSYNFV